MVNLFIGILLIAVSCFAWNTGCLGIGAPLGMALLTFGTYFILKYMHQANIISLDFLF